MKKPKQNPLLNFFVFLFLFNLVSACNFNNDFEYGKNVTICLQDCSLNRGDKWVDCDSSVNCFFSASSQNGTQFVNESIMNFNDSIFYYELGNLSKGYYSGIIKCNSGSYSYTSEFHFSVFDTGCGIKSIDSIDICFRKMGGVIWPSFPEGGMLIWLIVIFFLILLILRYFKTERFK